MPAKPKSQPSQSSTVMVWNRGKMTSHGEYTVGAITLNYQVKHTEDQPGCP